MREINSQDYENVIKEKNIVVVDFWAPWCPTCRMMMPNLEKMEAEYADVLFCKMDIVENEQFAKDNQVSTLPTVIFYKDGKEVERTTGFAQRVKLSAIIDGLK